MTFNCLHAAPMAAKPRRRSDNAVVIQRKRDQIAKGRSERKKEE